MTPPGAAFTETLHSKLKSRQLIQKLQKNINIFSPIITPRFDRAFWRFSNFDQALVTFWKSRGELTPTSSCLFERCSRGDGFPGPFWYLFCTDRPKLFNIFESVATRARSNLRNFHWRQNCCFLSYLCVVRRRAIDFWGRCVNQGTLDDATRGDRSSTGCC